MKNILKTFLWMTTAALAITSCTEDALDGLTGKYPAPEEHTFTSLISQAEEKLETTRIFTVEVATSGVTGTNGQYSGTGEVLSIQFVGDSYYLHPASFTPAAATGAKKGNYIIGSGTNSGSCFYTVSGSSATPHLVSSGTLSVAKSGDNYTITGNLWLDNGDVINVNFSGTIVYEADPDPVNLSKVLSASVTAQDDGTNLITLKLGTAGVTVVSGPYGDTYAGDGNYVSVDFISNDATLAAGRYTPVANGSGADGTYIKGYDTVVDWGWGPMEFFNWGTCWFTLANSEESGVHIETGDIVVAKDGTTYTITIENDDIYAQYVGKIEALTPAEIQLTNLFSASAGNNVVTLNISTPGITASYNAATYSWEYTGTGNYIVLEFYSADGTLAAGEYTAAANDAMGEFNFAKGYDTVVDWGWGPMEMFNWGTCWFTVANGTETGGKHLESGTITVAKDGADEYTITANLNGGDVQVKYVGPVVI